jgi:hypothetical protein
METFISFLIKASAGIILFYLVYWLFLRKETYHKANRWFLLTALLSSVLLPLFPVHYTLLMEQGNNTNLFVSIPDTFKHLPAVTGQEPVVVSFKWQQAVLLVYFTGAAIFLLRLITQTGILIHLIIRHRIKTLDGIRIVENQKYGLPFSFFNVIFINPKFHKQENLPEILAHEKVHIRENHWFDLLFIELLTVIFWFNPFIWFFERSIKQNHEYLADQGVLAQGHHVGRYQALLINQLMGMQIIGVTNNLNFALNTNRLKMMTKTKTSRFSGIKFLWALPAVALLLFAFAEPVYKANNTETENSVSTLQQGEKEFVMKGKVIQDKTGKPLHGASVIIKGTTVGTISDQNGNFTLTDPNPKKGENGGYFTDVVISYVGRETKSITVSSVDDKLEITIPDIKMEEGIVVIDSNDFLAPPPPPPPPPVNQDNIIQAPPPPPPPAKNWEEVFIVVEEMPEYPGGFYALGEYVTEMQKKFVQSNNVSGKSKIAFTVSETGKVTNVKIVEQDSEEIGKAAATVVMNMKDWEPGKQRGKPVPVTYLLPVEFK